MSYSITWDEQPLDAAAGFLKDDPEGLARMLVAVDALADDPRPAGTFEYGSPHRLRLRAGRYCVFYKVEDETSAVVVTHLGRI